MPLISARLPALSDDVAEQVSNARQTTGDIAGCRRIPCGTRARVSPERSVRHLPAENNRFTRREVLSRHIGAWDQNVVAEHQQFSVPDAGLYHPQYALQNPEPPEKTDRSARRSDGNGLAVVMSVKRTKPLLR